MHILHLVRSCDPRTGGPIEGVKLLARAAISQGHRVEVAALDSPDAAWLPDFPLSVHALGPEFGGYGWAPRAVRILRDQLNGVDAVVVNGLWQYQGALAHRLLAKGPIPYVVFTHGMLDPWFRRAYPLKHLKKQCNWWLHERRVLRDADLVLFTAERECELARSTFIPYRVREHVVGYGTADPGDPTPARAAFLVRHPQLAATRNLLFLSRIHRKKGCDLLIAAFLAAAKRVPSLRLVMAGPDEEGLRPDLERRAAEAGMTDRIVWAGMLQGELKRGAFAACEAFVLPSHQENFGIAVAEALAHGLPVLISDQINICREIANDGAGMIEADDLAGTHRLLARWLDLGPEQRQQMATAARACFLARFEIGTAASSLVSALEKARAIRADRVTKGDA